MEQTRFDVRFDDAAARERRGARAASTRAEFFVSPNPGEDLRPLARIVSGGELSRIMLAIKTLTATSRHGFSDAADRPPSASAPGLIFDEVDAGIGGRVADVVGRKLRTLGSAFQVLCITHLPQIAAYADTHFEIEKRVERRTHATRRFAGSTTTARVDEMARMLGGEAITDGLRARRLARCWTAARRRRRKAKAKVRRRRSQSRTDAKEALGVARKYLIETFGCQMNVHDSERMAGLLGRFASSTSRPARNSF